MTAKSQPAVRLVNSAEHDEVIALLVEAYATEWGLDGWSEYRVEMGKVVQSGDAVVLVAVLASAVVGTVTLVPASPLRAIIDDSAGELRLLAVAPANRRRGVGPKLIAAARTAANRVGLRSLVLQCDEDLFAAHRLYQRLGFDRDDAHDVEVSGGYRALGYRLDWPG